MNRFLDLRQGDCLELLKQIESNSIDSLVTDPPAGISFMGAKWDSAKGGRDKWVAWLTAVMIEVYRVLKPGSHGAVWALPRTSHWTATALENAGFEIREVVTNLFGSGFPKSTNVAKRIDKLLGVEPTVAGQWKPTGTARPNKNGKSGTPAATSASRDDYQPDNEALLPITAPTSDEAKRWNGFGTALKPASEHWIIIRKPIDGTIAQNVLKHGVGGINIGACRVEGGERTNVASSPTSTFVKGGVDSIVQGRWPANLLLSHSHDCDSRQCMQCCPVRLLDEQSGFTSSSNAPRNNQIAGSFPLKPAQTAGYETSGGASQFFNVFRPDHDPFYYTSKASTSEKNEGLTGKGRRRVNDGRKTEIDNPFQRGETSRINTHPAVKSQELMRWLCRLVTPHGGTILDAFAGSGSTLVAAHAEDFSAIGIERETEFYEIALARIAHATKQQKLFG